MKFLVLVFFFLITQAYANACTPEVTRAFMEADARDVTVMRISSDRQTLTSVEKNLIHRTVKSESGYAQLTQDDALTVFFSSNWGRIIYIKVDFKVIVKVQYYPNGAEFGTIYEQKYQADFRKVADISNGRLFCK